MPAFDYKAESDELALHLTVVTTLPDKTLSSSQGYVQAICHLIEEAHTDAWQKSVEEIEPDDFYSAILAAVARHYAFDSLEQEPRRAHELLRELVDQLAAGQYLQEWLPHSDE